MIGYVTIFLFCAVLAIPVGVVWFSGRGWS